MIDFISMNDFTRNEILEILRKAKELEENPQRELCKENIVSTLFFEPSTRTRLSFVTAAYRLGAPVHGFDSPGGTSLQKGESLRDTIKMAESYCDAIVIRHPRDGSARFAADHSKVPVINGGDGSNEHPSQTLLDLYTIQKEFGTLENIKITFVGDLKYGRTVHSLTKALSKFNGDFTFVAADEIQIPEYITSELEKKGLNFRLLSSYEEAIQNSDVLYVTRVQKERFSDQAIFEKVKNNYIVAAKDLTDSKEHMIIMHPLPRVNEIDIDVDSTKHARYFQQAANGVPVRESIIALAMGKLEFQRDDENVLPTLESSEKICINSNCITWSEKTENRYIEKNNKRFCYYCGREIKDVE